MSCCCSFRPIYSLRPSIQAVCSRAWAVTQSCWVWLRKSVSDSQPRHYRVWPTDRQEERQTGRWDRQRVHRKERKDSVWALSRGWTWSRDDGQNTWNWRPTIKSYNRNLFCFPAVSFPNFDFPEGLAEDKKKGIFCALNIRTPLLPQPQDYGAVCSVWGSNEGSKCWNVKFTVHWAACGSPPCCCCSGWVSSVHTFMSFISFKCNNKQLCARNSEKIFDFKSL